MSATATPSEIVPGDLIDLGEGCPPRCVTWSADGTCWGLTRLPGRKPRRPETVVYQVVGPVDDPDAWTSGVDVPAPELALAGAGAPPPGLPPAPPAVFDPASPDPVERVRAVFGPDVHLAADPETLADLVRKILAAQERRDPEVLTTVPAWTQLVEAAESGGTAGMVVAGRAVLDWCEAEDPERLGLGGWKRFVGQVEELERRDPVPVTRFVAWECLCPPEKRVPGEPCRQQYHTAS